MRRVRQSSRVEEETSGWAGRDIREGRTQSATKEQIRGSTWDEEKGQKVALWEGLQGGGERISLDLHRVVGEEGKKTKTKRPRKHQEKPRRRVFETNKAVQRATIYR